VRHMLAQNFCRLQQAGQLNLALNPPWHVHFSADVALPRMMQQGQCCLQENISTLLQVPHLAGVVAAVGAVKLLVVVVLDPSLQAGGTVQRLLCSTRKAFATNNGNQSVTWSHAIS